MDSEKKVILVTGGTGLLGTAIKDVIKEEGDLYPNEQWIFVGSKEADLCDKMQTRGLFEKYRPTHVANLAAIVGSVFYHLNNNLEIFRKNIFLNDNVLQTSYEYGVKKVISCLSTCAFPVKTTYPIDETMIQNGEPPDSNFGYCYAKRMILVTSRGYNEQFGCKFTSIIPCNVFGPNDNFHPINSQVVPGLIRKMYDAKIRGDETYSVYGTGKPLRQFIYSKDLAKIFVWALREYNETQPLIAAVGEEDEITIADMANMIKKCLNYEGKIIFDPTMSDGQLKKTASNKKLKSYLPNFKFTDINQALHETVDWFVAHHKEARSF